MNQTQQTDISEAQVAGSFLLAIMQAWKHPELFAYHRVRTPPDHIDPNEWYPFSMLTDLVEDVRAALPDCKALLFDAGVSFTFITYHIGVARNLMFSSRDWIQLNANGDGYRTVTRGPTAQTGWGRMLSHDETAGIVVYENLMPLRAEFLRGVYYGGFALFGDADYYRAEASESLPEPGNPHLWRTRITLHYRLTPAGIDPRRLQQALDQQLPASALSANEMQSLLWRMQQQREQLTNNQRYFAELNQLLTSAIRVARQQRDDMEQLANHDSLTGLPSLRLLHNSLAQAIADSGQPPQPLVVVFIDLDGFKIINDTYGHQAGDAVLQTVASRLRNHIRPDELAARLGGDEFVLMLRSSLQHTSPLTLDAQLQQYSQQVRQQLQQPLTWQTRTLQIDASIGWARYPDDATHLDDLLRLADHSMYSRKRQR